MKICNILVKTNQKRRTNFQFRVDWGRQFKSNILINSCFEHIFKKLPCYISYLPSRKSASCDAAKLRSPLHALYTFKMSSFRLFGKRSSSCLTLAVTSKKNKIRYNEDNVKLYKKCSNST